MIAVALSTADKFVKDGGEAVQAFQVRSGEGLKDPLARAREPDPDDPPVPCVGFPLDETGCLGSVDELNCAVRTEQHVVGKIAHRRGKMPGMPFDGHQQLMLDVG
jgi:hypothetical protein